MPCAEQFTAEPYATAAAPAERHLGKGVAREARALEELDGIPAGELAVRIWRPDVSRLSSALVPQAGAFAGLYKDAL